MALIECYECGAQVSDKASECPQCGNPMKNKSNKLKSIIQSDIFNKIVGYCCLVSALVCFWVSFSPYFFPPFFVVDYYLFDPNPASAHIEFDARFIYFAIIGIVLMLFAKKKLLPHLNSLYFILLIIACVAMGSYRYISSKNENEEILAETIHKQNELVNSPEFKQQEAGEEMLTKELKNCTNVKYLSDMPEDVINNYCNALNDLAIKTWNKPLSGLGLKVYQATYENDYGNQVTDRFYVFFKDDKPIKFAKENIIREWSELDMLFLMIHNFE